MTAVKPTGSLPWQPAGDSTTHGFAGASTAHERPARSWVARAMTAVLLGLVALAVGAIMFSPVALSSRDLRTWAASPGGLALPGNWSILVILSLDAAAIACVLMSVLCTWRGERPGAFSVLIWVFALTSALANWRHAHASHAPADTVWFFPAMSLTGPGILEVVLHRIRSWLDAGQMRPSPRVDGGRGPRAWQRWIPGLGSFTDTFGTYRTQLLIPQAMTFTEALQQYHLLCPNGSIRVARALRHLHQVHAYAQATSAADVKPGTLAGKWPVDLMRRIPVQTAPYRRWQAAWLDLQDADRAHVGADPNTAATGLPLAQQVTIAQKHQVSIRQLQFIRRAGQLRLLDSPIPPAVRLAHLSDLTGTRPQNITPGSFR